MDYPDAQVGWIVHTENYREVFRILETTDMEFVVEKFISDGRDLNSHNRRTISRFLFISNGYRCSHPRAYKRKKNRRRALRAKRNARRNYTTYRPYTYGNTRAYYDTIGPTTGYTTAW